MANPSELLSAAVAAHQRGQFAEAERLYREVLAIEPRSSAVLANLGALLQAQGRVAEGENCYRGALAIEPAHAQALCNLGSIFKDRGELGQASDLYRRAIVANPRLAEAHFNLGVIQQQQKDFAAAIKSYEAAIRAKPDYAQAHNNLGTVLRLQNDLDRAVACYELAVELRPEFADAHRNRALVWLLQGDFERGWPEYEWRLRVPELHSPAFAQPRWQGEPIAGRTILLAAEQGMGDTIQFVRYARLVKERVGAGRVLLACPPALFELLRDVAGVDRLVAPSIIDEPFDVYSPLMSLPGIFRTIEQSIPPAPYLKAASQRFAAWRDRLPRDGKFKVGIAWQGNPQYAGDYYRSVPLEHFAPLAACPNVTLFSLQKGHGREQLAGLANVVPAVDLGSGLDEQGSAFVDTAAVMMNLDLVITSDTAIPHLAGALGVPVWVALAQVPDWRFLLDRADSPWYPSMRLFRQQRSGDWPGVFARIAAQLASLSQAGSR